MEHALKRRIILRAATSIPLGAACSSCATEMRETSAVKAQLEKLEAKFGGRLGLFALDTAGGATLGYRDDERFPLCSIFKVLTSAAMLRRNAELTGSMQHRVLYRQSDLVDYSPITENMFPME